MKHTFRTIFLALIVGLLTGAAVATYALSANTHGRIGLEFDAQNAHEHVEIGHLNTHNGTDDDAVRALKFWGLKVGYGDSLTAIGVYSHRPTAAHAVNQSPRLPE